MTSFIADGEFPDDELTDITYMLESNDNYSDLLHDLHREDDGPGTIVRIGTRKHKLSAVIAAVEDGRASGNDYATTVKPMIGQE